jgi:hypothetical protein
MPQSNCYTEFEIVRYETAMELSRHDFEKILRESRAGYALRGSAGIVLQKRNRNWYMRLADF